MPRARTQVLESSDLMNTTQIFRESIRILLLHSTYFHTISIFLFSPLPVSLFISHFLINKFPQTPSSSILKIADHLLGQNGNLLLPNILSKAIDIIICLPSTVTFCLLGRAAIVQAVSDIYRGINLNGRRLFIRSGLVWVKLLHTSFWEFIILLCLFGALFATLATLPKVLFVFGICSRALCFWGVLGILGIPFCVAFAHVMVVGNLAKVLSVLDGECFGFDSLVKARILMRGRGQTALALALVSNVGFRLVGCLFEFRMGKGLSLWEGPILVSMYSLVLVLDTVTNVVFYYTCKPCTESVF